MTWTGSNRKALDRWIWRSRHLAAALPTVMACCKIGPMYNFPTKTSLFLIGISQLAVALTPLVGHIYQLLSHLESPFGIPIMIPSTLRPDGKRASTWECYLKPLMHPQTPEDRVHWCPLWTPRAGLSPSSWHSVFHFAGRSSRKAIEGPDVGDLQTSWACHPGPDHSSWHLMRIFINCSFFLDFSQPFLLGISTWNFSTCDYFSSSGCEQLVHPPVET